MSLPVFNRVMSYWGPGLFPATDFPSGNRHVQLYVLSRPTVDVQQEDVIAPPAAVSWVPGVYVRVDRLFLSDFPPPYVSMIWQDAIGPDELSVQWRCVWWEVMHLGFPNEYVVMQCVQCDGFGVSPDPGR